MQHDVITRWTCRLCGTARLDGGNYRHCPSCGHGRDHEAVAHDLGYEYLSASDALKAA